MYLQSPDGETLNSKLPKASLSFFALVLGHDFK